jgi:presenilin-like A22 family membrane protease
MRETTVILILIALFVCVQALGLYTGSQYLAAIREGTAQPLVENPQDVTNSFLFFAYIIGTTAIVILIILFKKILLRVLEAVAVFFTSLIVFDFTLPYTWWSSIMLATLLTGYKVLRPSILSQNLALAFSVAGAGAVLGASLGLFPVVVFMLILSAYDFVSVFISKHMVFMAKAITETPMAFTAAIPCEFSKPRVIGGKMRKVHVFQLGGGDFAIPMMFSVSVLAGYGIKAALFSIAGATVALALLFFFILRKPMALPALPPLSAGACAGFFLSMAL